MLQPATLKFLKGLKRNNNKPWFDKHRSDYEAAKKDFEVFIQAVIDAHSKKDIDLQNLVAKKCLFRINRDVRFAKDKSPYKKNFAASMDKGGKKSGLAGYYFHLEPGNSFIGAGIWQPEPPAMKKIRQEIDYNAQEFRKMIQAAPFKKMFKGLYTGENVQLKKLPHGIEKDNPAAEYLKFKSWMVLHELSDEELLSSSLLKTTLKGFSQAQPLVKFLNRPIES